MFRFLSKTPSALGPCPCSAPVSTSLAHTLTGFWMFHSSLVDSFQARIGQNRASVSDILHRGFCLKKIKHTLRTDNTVQHSIFSEHNGSGAGPWGHPRAGLVILLDRLIWFYILPDGGNPSIKINFIAKTPSAFLVHNNIINGRGSRNSREHGPFVRQHHPHNPPTRVRGNTPSSLSRSLSHPAKLL